MGTCADRAAREAVVCICTWVQPNFKKAQVRQRTKLSCYLRQYQVYKFTVIKLNT